VQASVLTIDTCDNVVNLTFVNYPASPDVTLQYDPLNRLTNMVDAAGTTRYTFTTGGQLWTEDGPFASDTVTSTYQNRLRVGLSLQQPTGAWTNGFSYGPTRRLAGITSAAGAFGYDFSLSGVVQPGSLVRRVSLPNGGYITNTYDAVARLTGTWLKKSDNTVLDSATYGINVGNQRTTFTNAAGTYVGYAYDNIGQLKVADSSVNTEERGYTYDKAWNLNYRTNNGALSTFTVDTRNQLVSVPGGSCSYDANGNLVTNTATGLGYAYDDENRLITVQYAPWTNNPGPPPDELSPLMQQPQYTPGWKANFTYDGLGRLRVRADYANTANGWYLTNTVLYVYAGNRVIQERNAANTPTVSYTRGTDLSGTLEGAGGIGGLLARSSGYSAGNWTSHAYYHADGNGNITCLVDGTQAVAASYRYDPFGNLISKSGTLADANLYRFSSKEFHVNSGLYYYLYRFYDPNTQRWINRDPIEGVNAARGETRLLAELLEDGPNLYEFDYNNAIDFTDPLGLKWCWGGFSSPFCFFNHKRDCDSEYNDCMGRGKYVCAVFGGALGGIVSKPGWALGGGLGGAANGAGAGVCGVLCMSAYQKACNTQKTECQKWNTSHGY
jgi:RHS repeat-associated protein